jgi:uncharacterized membrane protein
MFQLPTPPPWEGLHPLVIHFPVALLSIAPLFILLAIIFKEQQKSFTIAAFVLILIGTLGAIVGVMTGEAAMTLAKRSPEINVVMSNHQAMMETVRNLAILLLLFYGVFTYFYFKGKFKASLVFVLQLIFLIFSGVILLLMTIGAHQGARLVHEFGIQSIM